MSAWAMKVLIVSHRSTIFMEMQQKNDERQKTQNFHVFNGLKKKCNVQLSAYTNCATYGGSLTLKFSLISSTYGTVTRNIFHSLGTACYHMCSKHTKLPNEKCSKYDKHKNEFFVLFSIYENEQRVFFSQLDAFHCDIYQLLIFF